MTLRHSLLETTESKPWFSNLQHSPGFQGVEIRSIPLAFTESRGMYFLKCEQRFHCFWKFHFFCSDCQELKYYQVSKITSRGRTENGTQGEQSAKLKIVWKETRVQMPAESFSSNFLGLRKTKFEEMLLLSRKPLQLARRPHLQNGIRKSQGKGDCLLRAFMTACCHSPGRQR